MYTKYTTEVAVDHHYLHCLRGEKGYEVFDKTLVEDLTKTDDQFNCLAKHFRKVRDFVEGNARKRFCLRLYRDRRKDPSVYNIPDTDEVVALIVRDLDSMNFGRDITRARTGPRRSSSGPRSNRKGTMTSPTNVPSSMCSFMNNANFTHVNLEGTGECNIVYNYWRKTTKIGSRWSAFFGFLLKILLEIGPPIHNFPNMNNDASEVWQETQRLIPSIPE
ncbi:hypothetical protein JHK84_045334 [Glycine max]|nr:hypothetical protein JHK84_045334 [Glycine max]